MSAEATKRVWPEVKWMKEKHIPAMYDVVVVNYPNNQHWMYLTVANLRNNMHLMLDLQPRHPFARLPDKLQVDSENSGGPRDPSETVPSTPDSSGARPNPSQGHGHSYSTRNSRNSNIHAPPMPRKGPHHDLLTVDSLLAAFMDSSREVLFFCDATFDQDFDAVLEAVMNGDGNLYRAMERTSAGEGAATWMKVDARSLRGVWDINLTGRGEAVKTEKEMRIEEDIEDVPILTVSTHWWAPVLYLQTHHAGTRSILSLMQEACVNYHQEGTCSITLIVTAPGKQHPVALHADYLDRDGVGLGRHQIVFCLKGTKTFQTLPQSCIPDDMRPAAGSQFVEILDCTPSTHADLPWTESRLEAGMVLYLPPNTYHRVKSDELGTVTLMIAIDIRHSIQQDVPTHQSTPQALSTHQSTNRFAASCTGEIGQHLYVCLYIHMCDFSMSDRTCDISIEYDDAAR